MTEQPDSFDVEVEIAQDPTLQLDLAVAEVQLRLEQLLEEAVDNAEPFDVDTLAETLGVDADRVNRILDGTDLLKLESFVRYTRLLGFTAHVSLAPTEPVALADRAVIDHFSQVGADASGVSPVLWRREAASLDVEPMSDLQYERTTIGGITFVDASRTELSPIARGETYNLTEPRARHRTGGHIRV
jgi:plasmid maintenance system antidote protein VapI